MSFLALGSGSMISNTHLAEGHEHIIRCNYVGGRLIVFLVFMTCFTLPCDYFGVFLYIWLTICLRMALFAKSSLQVIFIGVSMDLFKEYRSLYYLHTSQ